MKHLLLASCLLLTAYVCPAVAQEAPAAPKSATKTDSQKKIESLVKNLAADDYEVRESATSDLLKLGRRAVPTLQSELKKTSDPEVKNRLQFILKQLNALPAKPKAPQPKSREGIPPKMDGIPAPDINEMFKDLAVPEGFKKLFGGLQKELEKELERSMKDMMNPNNNGQQGKPRVRVWTFPQQPGQQAPKGQRTRPRDPSHKTGLTSTLISPALRTHLQLQEGEIGIIITSVKAKSWAATSGFKIHDIILAVEDTPVTSLDDLDPLDEKSLSVTIIRRGDRMTKALPKLNSSKSNKAKQPKDF